MTKVWTMSEAAGASARAIRQDAGATLAQVAKAAKGAGLPWSSGRVGDFESGRIAASLPTLIAVTGALTEVVRDRQIALADLFEVDGRILVNDAITLEAERLRDLLRGKPFELVVDDMPDRDSAVREVSDVLSSVTYDVRNLPPHLRHDGIPIGVFRRFAEGDDRLARSLGADWLTAAAAMNKAWGKTFVERRDELAGPDANAQKKGIVARKLKAELRSVIDGDNQ